MSLKKLDTKLIIVPYTTVKAGLKDSTEALYMAAQEQTPSHRSIETGVHTIAGRTQVADCAKVPQRRSSI